MKSKRFWVYIFLIYITSSISCSNKTKKSIEDIDEVIEKSKEIHNELGEGYYSKDSGQNSDYSFHDSLTKRKLYKI